MHRFAQQTMRIFHCARLLTACLGSLLIASCISHARPSVAGAASEPWRYEVSEIDGGAVVSVLATFPPGTATELVVQPGAGAFVAGLELAPSSGDQAGEWLSARADGGGEGDRPVHVGDAWGVTACASGCRVRYRFLLRDAAVRTANVDVAAAFGDMYEAPIATWLIHPAVAPEGARFKLHVTTSPGVAFVTGVFRGNDGTYEADAAYLPVAPYSAFGAMRISHPVTVPGVDLELAIAAQLAPSSDAVIERWLASASRATSRYFGAFPVSRSLVVVAPVDGVDVRRGHALGDGGASIVVEVGRDVTEATLRDDWILPHELIHLGFPSVSRRHHWMEEGVAVYVQPIVRARAGDERPEAAWRELALGLPRGQPRDRDRGLDDTTNWSRTYWGGALFCLLADLGIRERTGNRLSLDDALRGIVHEGGNIATEWDFMRVLDAGDRAVGVPVLRELYAQMGDKPVHVDLETVYRKLGIVVKGEDVTFDDSAPLAKVRRAIMGGT